MSEENLPGDSDESNENGLEFVGGNDVDLLYYYECEKCGTVVVDDHSDSLTVGETPQDYGCPNCKDLGEDKYPFEFYRKEELSSTYKRSFPPLPLDVMINHEKGFIDLDEEY